MSRFHNLDASIARALDQTAPAPSDDPEGAPMTPDEPEGEPDSDQQHEEEAAMADETPLIEREDYKAGLAAGTAAANDRMKTVFASEHTLGREAHAVRLLGNAKLTADEIVAELPNFTKAEANALTPEQQAEAAERGGRAEMREAMEAAGNKSLGGEQPNNDGKSGRAASAAVWDKANAAIGRVKKEG